MKKPLLNPSPVISFSDEDYLVGMLENHQDALVITTKVGTNMVKKILIENGSSVDIRYHSSYSRMELGGHKLENVNLRLYGFTCNEVKVVGVIDRSVFFGSLLCQTLKVVKFHVLNATSNYKVILGRMTLTTLNPF